MRELLGGAGQRLVQKEKAVQGQLYPQSSGQQHRAQRMGLGSQNYRWP